MEAGVRHRKRGEGKEKIPALRLTHIKGPGSREKRSRRVHRVQIVVTHFVTDKVVLRTVVKPQTNLAWRMDYANCTLRGLWKGKIS
jgi:hypothetical protein